MRSFLKVPIQIKDISCLITYRLTEYNFDFQCKQKIKLTCLLGYLFIQSFFTFFGLRSSWNYVIFLQIIVWWRKNDENVFFLGSSSWDRQVFASFLLWFYIWFIPKTKCRREWYFLGRLKKIPRALAQFEPLSPVAAPDL